MNYCNSTTAYGRILLDGAEASTDDIVAAFIAGECRGRQHINLLNEQSYVTLEINGETVEEVEFVIYDASENLIYQVDFITNTYPGFSIGYPPDFLPLFATSANANHLPYLNLPVSIELDVPGTFTWNYGIDFFDDDNDLLYLEYSLPEDVNIILAEPDWQPVSYSGVTMMFGETMIAGEPAESGDIVGAFVAGECRAVSEVDMWDSTPFVALSVYGTTVSAVSFRIHDVSAGSTWEADLEVNSEPGGMIGYPDLLMIDGAERILESDFSINIETLPEENEVISITLADFPPFSIVRQEIILDVGSSNQPPVIALPLASFNEDGNLQIDLDDFAYDPEGVELGFQILNSSPVLVQLCQHLLNLQAPPNWNGEAYLEIFATDGGRLYAVDTLWVEVLSVNDPPVLIVPEQIIFSEDSTGTLDLSSSYDIEGDSLEITFGEQNILEIQRVAPDWQSVSYNNFAYAYLRLSYNGQNLAAETMIAAYVDGECRGTTDTYLYQNDTYAIFPIYCQENSTVIFKAYDAVDEVVFFSDPVSIVPGSNLGFPPDYYQVEFIRTEKSRTFQMFPPENWNGTQILELSVFDSNQAGRSQDILVIVMPEPDAPQVNDLSLSFAATMEDWYDLSEYIYEPDGEGYSLLITDAAGLNLSVEGSILNISPAPDDTGLYQNVIRVEDSTGLTADMEIEIEILPVYDYGQILVQGWNWFSLPVGANHFEPEYRLAFLEDSADYLKAQTGFINYNAEFGWVGSLMNISQQGLYKAHLLELVSSQPEGWVLDPEDTAVELYTGWNWISYIPAQAMSINEALAPLAGNLDYIKGQSGYALYYEGIGWIGPLQYLYPGCGYVAHAQANQVFYYPQPDRAIIIDKQDTMISNKMKVADFEYTASLTAVIPGYIPQTDDELIAYAGDEIAGYAALETNSIFDLRAGLGEFYYFITLYTNQGQPGDLQLTLMNKQMGKEVDFSNCISWTPDDCLGDLEQPVTLHLTEATSNETDAGYAEIIIYPNPLKPGSSRSKLYINFSQKIDRQSSQASLYNMKGQRISSLDIIPDGDNWTIVSESNWDYPNGVYLLSFKAESFNYQTKLLILK